MTFEQPASLNRFIVPPIPNTWTFRWKLFKLSLPGLILVVFFLEEGLLFQEWVKGAWDFRPVLILFVVPVVLLTGFELLPRLERKYKRILKLRDSYVQTGLGLAQRVRWPNIIAWQFYTIPDEKNYQIVTMEY